MKRLLPALGLLLAIISLNLSAASPDSHEAKRLGFFPAADNVAISQIPFSELTHVAWAFGTIAGNHLSVPNTAKLDSVVAIAHGMGVKVVLSLGGASWPTSSSNLLRSLSADTNALNTYIAEVTAFCLAHSLDGVDVDFEGEDVPGDSLFGVMYSDYLNRSYAQLHPLGLSLSADMYGGDYYAHYFDAESFQDKCDWITIMSGQDNGMWNPAKVATNPSTLSIVKYQTGYWSGRVDASKLVLGIVGFTGLSFQGALLPGEIHDGVAGPHATDGQGFLPYKNIFALDSANYSYVQGDENTGSYVSGMSAKGASTVEEIIFFDSRDDIAAKARHARTAGLAGVMYWNIGLDYAPEDPSALIHAIHYGLTDSVFNPTSVRSVLPTIGTARSVRLVEGGNRIALSLGGNGMFAVSLLSLSGRVLGSSDILSSGTETSLCIPGNISARGAYVLRIAGKGSTSFHPLVIP